MFLGIFILSQKLFGEYVYTAYLSCMERKRAIKSKEEPREVITGRIRPETRKLVDKFLSKNTTTKSELVDIALYDYLSR